MQKTEEKDRIALINPCYDYPITKKRELSIYNRIWPPLSLAYCAAILEENGFYVRIIDANAERLDPEKVAERVCNFDKIFITSSSLDRWQCPHVNIDTIVSTIEEIKKQNSKNIIYLMGVHGTVKPKEILDISGADVVIRGEPELTVLRCCEGVDLSRIDGITYKKSNKVVSNPDGNPPNLDSLPLPAFHLLPMEKYTYEVLGDHFTLFEASRSCPFSCTFCLKKMFHSYRKKSVEKLIDEVEYAIENFGVKTAYFIDLEFTINSELVEKLCDFLIDKRYDFRWCCQTRADSVNEKLLQKMKRAGCSLIHYGVETGSERILRQTNKGITLEEIEKGINLTKRVGIDTACFFMFGLPTETKKDMQKTIKFAKKLDPTYASFHIASPYPGTIFYDMIKNETDEDFPIAYTGSYSLSTLKKIVNRAFLEFYLRPSYVLSMLRRGNLISLLKQFRLFLGYIR